MMNTTRPQHLFPCPRTQSGTLWRIGLTAALLCTLGARTADAQKRGNALTLPQIAEDGGLSPRQPVLQGEAPTLVAVFATWCGYCGHEVPMLNRLQRQLADRGGRVVGISVDTGSPTEVGRWMRRYRVDYPVFQSDRRIRSGRSFMGNPSALPLTLLVSERGQVLERWVGAVPERRLIAALRPYLSTSRKQSKNDQFDR